jgi:hypothetical protein
MSAAFVSILSLITAIVVAVLGHLFASRRKRTDELAELRLKAYTDFITAASRLASARRLGQTDDDPNDIAILNDAKTRICICADSEVIDALAEFWAAGGTLELEQGTVTFSRLCAQMRKSLGNDYYFSKKHHLSNILFKLEPDKYSYRVEQAEKSASETLG